MSRSWLMANRSWSTRWLLPRPTVIRPLTLTFPERMELFMRHSIAFMIAAALLTGAAALFPQAARAGSCCGGGSPTSLIVPKYARAIVDMSFDVEIYDGFWNQDGKHIDDPPGSD